MLDTSEALRRGLHVATYLAPTPAEAAAYTLAVRIGDLDGLLHHLENAGWISLRDVRKALGLTSRLPEEAKADG